MAERGKKEYKWSELGLNHLEVHIAQFPPNQLWQLRCFTIGLFGNIGLGVSFGA